MDHITESIGVQDSTEVQITTGEHYIIEEIGVQFLLQFLLQFFLQFLLDLKKSYRYRIYNKILIILIQFRKTMLTLFYLKKEYLKELVDY